MSSAHAANIYATQRSFSGVIILIDGVINLNDEQKFARIASRAYGPASTNSEDRRGEVLGDNTRELKRLNDQLYTMLNPPDKAGVGSSANPADGADGSSPGPTITAPGSTPSKPSLLGPPPPTPNYGPSNPPPAGAVPTPGLFEHTPMGVVCPAAAVVATKISRQIFWGSPEESAHHGTRFEPA